MDLNKNIVNISISEDEYMQRLRYRLAMQDILEAHHDCYMTVNSPESQDLAFADRVNEIIEGWEI